MPPLLLPGRVGWWRHRHAVLLLLLLLGRVGQRRHRHAMLLLLLLLLPPLLLLINLTAVVQALAQALEVCFYKLLCLLL